MFNDRKAKAKEVIRILEKRYPNADCTLDFKTPFQLLIATILAAQSTDKNVNRITPKLFAKYPTPQDFANADPVELENDIRSTGFFRQKAKAIIEASQDIVSKYGGEIPDDIDALTKLPGVGRKTANVVLGAAFGKPAIIVDTHMLRVTGRLGLVPAELSKKKDAEKVEIELMKIIDKEYWTKFSHMIVAFGRDICDAKKPKCDICPLLHICEYGQAKLAQS